MFKKYISTMPPKSEPSNRDPARFNETEEFARPAVRPTNTIRPPARNKLSNRRKEEGRQHDNIIGPCEDVALPCEDGARYIDPSDCRSYYVCASRQRLVRLTCPLGTAWHHRAKVCVDDKNVYNKGLCDKRHPSNRCPGNTRITNSTTHQIVTETTTRRTIVPVLTVSKKVSKTPTLLVQGSKSGIHSKSRITTPLSREMEATPGGPPGRSDAEVIVIAVVGGLIFAALIAIILVLIWRKRREEKSTESDPTPRNVENKPQRLSIDNPEYTRRNSAIYAEIEDTMRGPLMTSTVSRDLGKTMCARLEHHLPPPALLPEPMRPQFSTISSSTSGVVSPGPFYSEPGLESERNVDSSYYEKLSVNNSDINIRPVSNQGYEYVEGGAGHVYSTLSTKAKDTRYELLNEMSSASANPSEGQGRSASSSPAVGSTRVTGIIHGIPADYFTVEKSDTPDQK